MSDFYLVGPVFTAGQASQAVVAAIRELNPQAFVEDRGGYIRVSVRESCFVTRDAIERQLGRAFRLPEDLEGIMCAFSGMLSLSEDRVEWTSESTGKAF